MALGARVSHVRVLGHMTAEDIRAAIAERLALPPAAVRIIS